MKIGAVIIAGGRSTRMGREKALIELAGNPIIQWIIDRVAPQVRTLAINANGNGQRYKAFGLPVVPDVTGAGTPLAGLHAALSWGAAHGCDAVVTVPSDSPFLPRDLVARLTGEGPAVAASGGQTHYLTGLWPVGLLLKLEDAFHRSRHSRESGNPAFYAAPKKSGAPAFAGVTEEVVVTPLHHVMRMQDWVSQCEARTVAWPADPFDPFFNVNTPDELAEAEAIAAEFHP